MRAIEVKQLYDQYFMSGIRLIFDDGTKTPWLQTESAKNEKAKLIEFGDIQISAISVNVAYGRVYCGIRLFNENMDISVNEELYNKCGGTWTKPQKIPSGLQVIGLNANVPSDSKYIKSLGFILGP